MQWMADSVECMAAHHSGGGVNYGSTDVDCMVVGGRLLVTDQSTDGDTNGSD